MKIKNSKISISEDSSLFVRLRNETRSEHESVEKSLELFRKDFSLNDYFRLLNSFREFYQLYEEQISEVFHTLPISFEIDLRCKMPLLNEDLKNQLRPLSLELPEIPTMHNVSETIGAMYVMEGSTLGGQIIYRHLQKTLNLELNQTSFFRGYNESTGLMWSKFKLESEKLIEPKNFEVVIASAKKTFTCLGNWLELCQR